MRLLWRCVGSCALLAVALAAGSEEERFVVVQVQCPGEPMVLEHRTLSEMETPTETTTECRERLVAIVDPSEEQVESLASEQAAGAATLHKPGWPRTFTAFSGGPLTLADLGDPRGLATVIQNVDGTLDALASDGEQLPGWPMPFPSSSPLAVAAVDLLGDARDELLLAGGAVHALSSEGVPLPGWPFTGGGFLGNIPIGARFEAEGPVRTVSAGALPPSPSTTAGAFVLDERGDPLPGWPAVIPKGTFVRPLAQGPAVGDVTGDGVAEVVVPVLNEQQMWVFDSSGATLPGFPVEFDLRPDDPSLGDLDGDGAQEIVFWAAMAPSRGIAVMKGDGTMLPGWPQVTNAIGNFGPALGDVDGDGRLEVLASTVGGTGGVFLWRHDGTPVPGWPKLISLTSFPNPPTIGDVDGDGVGDVIVTGLTAILPSDGVIYAWRGDGALIPGFPIVIPFRPVSITGAATIADIDHDGIVELGVTSSPGLISRPATIHWFDLGVPYRPEGMEWPAWAHDHARTGSYAPPVRRVPAATRIAPPQVGFGTPVPPLTVLLVPPDGETARPRTLRLRSVNGQGVTETEGAFLEDDGEAAVFRFDGDAVRDLLPGPGEHLLGFWTEAVGGLHGVLYEGEASLTARDRPRRSHTSMPRTMRPRIAPEGTTAVPSDSVVSSR